MITLRLSGFLLILCLLGSRTNAQNQKDLKALLSHSSELENRELNWHADRSDHSDSKSGLAEAFLHFYQDKLTYYFYSHCIYEESCSEFSRQAFQNTGPISALFLSIDRLGRCNQLEYLQAAKNESIDGKVSDPVKNYIFR